MAVGTAFVQLVPSLRGFHQQTRRELSGMDITGEVDLKPEIDTAAAKTQAKSAAKAASGEQISMFPDLDVAAGRRQASTAAGLMRRTVPFDVNLHGTGARTQATALANSMRRDVTFNVDVDRNRLGSAVGAVAAGGRSMSVVGNVVAQSFTRTGLSIAALGPLVVAAVGVAAAGIMALPAVLAAVAVPIAAIIVGIEGIKAAAATVAPAFATIQTAVAATFQQVLTPVFAQLATLVPILRAGLVGTAQALGVMAAAITGVVTSAQGMLWMQQIFAGVNALIAGLAPAMATLTGTFMQLAATAIGPLTQGLIAAVGQFALLFQQMVGQISASGLLQASMTLFTQTLGILLSILPPLLAAGLQMFMIFGPSMNQAFLALIPVLGPIMQLFGVLTAIFFQLLAAVLPVIGALATALTPVLAALMPVVSGIAMVIGTILVGALRFLTPMLQTLAPVIAVLVGAWLAWTAASWALNLALSANPITWIIIGIIALVAAVIYAWHNFDWFRIAVTACWNAIVTAAQFAWTIIGAVLAWIGGAVTAVGGFFVWLWQAIVVPAWNAIAGAFLWAWTTVIQPVLGFIGTALAILGAIIFTVLVAPFVIAWNILSAAVSAAWTFVIKPTWDAMAAAAGWLYNTVLAPIFGFIGAAWHGLAAGVRWVFDAILRPAWDAVAAAARWLFDTVLRPIFDAIGAAWNFMARGVMVIWNSVLRPAWDAVAAMAGWLWNAVLAPTFGFIGAAWHGLLAGIAFIWNSILRPCWDAVAAAARWLWDTILRPVFDAIGAGWRATMDGIRWVYDTILRPAFDAVKGAAHSVGQAFANVVNWIRDTWSTIGGIAKAPINFVIDVVYNRGIVPVWNGIAGVFGLGKLQPAAMLAAGGTVPAGPMSTNRPTAVVGEGNTSRPEYVIPTDPKHRGRASALWASAGADLGMPQMQGGGILGDAWRGLKSVVGGAVGGVGDAFGWVSSIIGDAVGGVRKLFGRILGAGEQTPGTGSWTDALKKIPVKVVDAVIEKVKGFVASFGGGGGPFGAMSVAGAQAVQAWAPVVLQALAMLGQPAAFLGITLRRMAQESGGNPNIGNFWDSNAAKGTPSMGLMQVIGPTFSAYRDPRAPNNILDPLANILASMRYALARYGSLPAAYNKAGGYDSGGWLPPGANLTYNGTRRPEAILTAEQWKTMQAAADGETQRDTTINVSAPTNASPERIAAAVDRRLALSGRL